MGNERHYRERVSRPRSPERSDSSTLAIPTNVYDYDRASLLSPELWQSTDLRSRDRLDLAVAMIDRHDPSRTKPSVSQRGR